ncbi:MAG: hypothetical protein QXK95_02935 [Nitrososphaerota archaeon]
MRNLKNGKNTRVNSKNFVLSMIVIGEMMALDRIEELEILKEEGMKYID